MSLLDAERVTPNTCNVTQLNGVCPKQSLERTDTHGSLRHIKLASAVRKLLIAV